MPMRAGWETRARSAIIAGLHESAPDAYTDIVAALGADHPLPRTQRAVDIATGMAVHTSALVLVAPCLAVVGGRLGVAAGVSAALVAAALWVVVAVLGSCRKRCIHDLILEGGAPALPLIRSESSRLVEPARRARVACMLDTALDEGVHWHEYFPASRPPPGVRHLPPNDRLIHEITSCLRDGRATPRAMILLHRLVEGGYGAAVYQGGPDWVRRELGRIRFELLDV
jgi:hypothetical protein